MNLRHHLSQIALVVGAVLLSIGVQAFAFTQPSTSPPNGDASAPLDTSANAQAKTGGLLLNTGGATNGLIVQSGNVGIGTVSPGAKLEIDGTTAQPVLSIGDSGIDNGNTYGMVNLTRPADTAKALLAFIRQGNYVWQMGYVQNTNTLGFFPWNFSGSQGTPTLALSGGNVGIGTNSPGVKLDVSGDISVERNYLYLAGPGDTNHAIHNTTGDGEQFRFWNFLDLFQANGGASRLYINGSGNVGIGTTNPAGKLDVAGSICLSGSCITSWPSSSGGNAATLSGVDISRIVYGDNSTKTTSISDPNSWLSSGFYNGYTGTNVPYTSWWALLNLRHVNTANNYGFQLLGNFYNPSDFYYRIQNGDSFTGGWQRIWTSGNLTNVSQLANNAGYITTPYAGEFDAQRVVGNTNGVTGISTTGGYGVTGTGGPIGVYGSGTGQGVYGSGSYGVYGNGTAYGVYGNIAGNGSGGYGVYGEGGFTGTYGWGTSYGVHGQGGQDGVYGEGIVGVAGSGSNSYGSGGIGVSGYGWTGVQGYGASGVDFQGSHGEYTSGANWVNGSSRNLKENFTPVDAQSILGKIDQLPITEWVYKTDTGAKHIGPVAEDFYSIFGLGDNNKSISTIDPAGVALVGVQALDSKINAQQKTIDTLQKEIEALQQQVQELLKK